MLLIILNHNYIPSDLILVYLVHRTITYSDHFQEALNEAAMSSAAGKKGHNSLAMAAQDCRILVKTLGDFSNVDYTNFI